MLNRREFVATTASVGAGLAFPANLLGQAPAVLRGSVARPVIVASDNGNISRDASSKTCVVKAFEMMSAGADLLDALVAGVNIVELDPKDTSVGYGGLPNA
ncbi:MAG: N(4)-(beta-N-acetylglucosaminyl)-L-asparaginase, partial [Longimicrobiales bacterium]